MGKAMSKRTDLPTARAPRAEVAAFLAEARARPPRSEAGRGRLIFALDATMSRQPTWDLACQLQAEMFDAATGAGGLEVQLVYYRGHAEAQASRWVSDAAALKGLMTGIACHGGLTQIGRVLDHANRAAAKRPVAALVFVGDAMEENLDRLCHKAGELSLRNTRAFMFHEGARSRGGPRLSRDRPADRRRLPAVRRGRGGRAARAAPRGRRLGRRRTRGAGGLRHARGPAAARRPQVMTPTIWAGLILLGFGAVAILRLRLSQQQQIAAVVLAAAAGLALVRMFPLAVPVALFGIGLWRRAAPIVAPADTSEVTSAGLRMTLDHDTGTMEGEVLTGRFKGARLTELSAADLQALSAEFQAAGDEDSLSLLLAWLDRTGKAREEAPPAGGQAMTEAEAYRVLGLEPGATVEEVRAAYHRLIRRVHPDLGGSSALAAMINAAKEMLDPG